MSLVRALCALLIFAPAAASAKAPYMWGVGPRLGTIVLPGGYPVAFPQKIARYDMDDDGVTDVDGQGNPMQTSLSRSRFEGIVGANAVYYLDKRARIGGVAGVGIGGRFADVHLIGLYDRVLTSGSSVDLLAGGGVGVGWMRFGGSVGQEALSLPYYPLRLQLLGQFRDDTRAYQLGLAGQFDIPGRHRYTSQAGERVDVRAPFNYLQLNVELTVMFGDFTPPKRKKGGRRQGGRRR